MAAQRSEVVIVKFLEKHRTRISQILGVVYILVFTFSEKKLDTTMPVVTGIMSMAGLTLVGAATAGRLWCAQYIAGYKTESLITVGPYSVCRNPLYFFSLLGGIGIGLCTESVTLALTVPVVFAVIYPLTIFQEEKKLHELHAEAYGRYMSSVPRFFPNWSLFHTPPEYVVNTKVFRRELMDSICFLLVAGLFEIIEELIDTGSIATFFALY